MKGRLTISVAYGYGETVFLKTDPEQLPRIVVAYRVDETKIVLYVLAHIKDESTHYESEITNSVNRLVVTGFKKQ